MPNGTPVVIRLCDHRGECLDVNYQLRIDGRVIEVDVYHLDSLMDALSDAEFELGMGDDDGK